MRKPDFKRFRTMLLRNEEPDYVPLGDTDVHPLHKEAILGRPVRTLEDEVAFWATAGYDYVPVEQGLQLTELIRRGTMTENTAQYAVDTQEEQSRSWVNEGKGLITTRGQLEDLTWPDPDDLDYSTFERIGKQLPEKMRVIAILGKVFSCTWWLMGLEGMSMALVDEPDLVREIFEKVAMFQFRVFENMLRFDCIGAVWHADDIAFSTQLMVNPRLLREHVFPWYKKMNDLAHAQGWLAIYHSDGALQQALDDIVGSGFDGLNPIEPKAMDINKVKREYGSRISILGNIDLGYTLTRGTPEEVRQEVQQRIRDLAPGGGYAVASSNSIPEYVPLANFNAMREAVFEYGKYPIAIHSSQAQRPDR